MPRRRRTNHQLRVSKAEMLTAEPPPLAGVDESMVDKVNEVQRLLGYRFRDPKLLQEALTHSSYPDRPSYKRLKHLGVAALNLAFTNYFFITNSDVGPRDLTAFRASNISNPKFARIAVQHRLYRFIRHNSPALDRNVDDFDKVLAEIVKSIAGAVYVDCKFNIQALWKADVLADTVESIAGAVYVDCNFNVKALWKVIRGFLEPIVPLSSLDGQPWTALLKKEPLGSATCSSSSGENAATPKFSSEYLRDHIRENSRSSKLPPAPSSSRLAQAPVHVLDRNGKSIHFSDWEIQEAIRSCISDWIIQEDIRSCIEREIQVRVPECDDCNKTSLPRVDEGSKPKVNLPSSSSLKVGGTSEQNQISKLDASGEALLNLSGSEPEKMSADSSLNGVEEKEEAKHKLGILCDWQKLVYKFWRAVVVGIKLMEFVTLVAFALCLSLIFFSVVVNHVFVN